MPKITEELLAYLSTLAALIFLVGMAMLICAFYPHVMGKLETFGLGTVTGGLIGLMRIPRAKSVFGDGTLVEGTATLGYSQDNPGVPEQPLSPPPPQRGK